MGKCGRSVGGRGRVRERVWERMYEWVWEWECGKEV